MKTLMLTVALLLAIVLPAHSGTTTVSVGQMDGHSVTRGRCVNPGYYLDIEHSDIQFTVWDFMAIDIGWLVTASKYETASREFAGGEEWNQKQKLSITPSVYIKPSVTYGNLTAYLSYGTGLDWMQEVGISTGHFVGRGLTFKVTERVSAGWIQREYYRSDTGNYRTDSLTIIVNF